MSIFKSGMWCDLCRKPILSGEWWHIRVNGKEGHACAKCKTEYELAATVATGKDER